MHYKNYYHNSLIILSLISIFYSIFLLLNNISNFEGYWYDEWCTLLNADPNSSLDKFYERLNGNNEKPYENVPAIYYLSLRFFFNVFGYSTENGRIFSLIFFLMSTLSFYLLLRKFLKNYQSFLVVSIFFSTPLIFWMSNETRVDMYLLFFSIINTIVFLKLVKLENNLNKFNLLFINIFLLSLYPLTISLIISQLFFSIMKKKFNIFLLIVISLVVYFFVNYDYIIDKTTNREYHFAKLNLNFFLGYYFNIFFGSVVFGAIFLSFFVYFLIKNINKIIQHELLLFTFICIVFTYLMVIVSTLFVTPIAAPRYIIFIIPYILVFIFSNIFLFEKSRKLTIFFFIISLLNISYNYNEQPIKKPKIYNTLNLIKKLDEKNIFLEPQQKLYTNYISSITQIDEFNIINKIDINNKKINSFIVLCLNYPSFAYATKPKEIHKDCLSNYYGYEEIKKINYDDFYIRYLKLIY